MDILTLTLLWISIDGYYLIPSKCPKILSILSMYRSEYPMDILTLTLLWISIDGYNLVSTKCRNNVCSMQAAILIICPWRRARVCHPPFFYYFINHYCKNLKSLRHLLKITFKLFGLDNKTKTNAMVIIKFSPEQCLTLLPADVFCLFSIVFHYRKMKNKQHMIGLIGSASP